MERCLPAAAGRGRGEQGRTQRLRPGVRISNTGIQVRRSLEHSQMNPVSDSVLGFG
jgi:hypothetical protein